METVGAIGQPGGLWQEASEKVLLRWLDTFRGALHSYFILTRLPEGVDFENAPRPLRDEEFMQAAGTRERLTLEIRYRTESGEYRHVTLGRGPVTETTETISRGEHEIEVFSHEVFNATEAAELMSSYLSDGFAGGNGSWPGDLTERLVDGIGC